MATHSSTLAWKIPWTEEPGRLQSMGLQRVKHNWVTSLQNKTYWKYMDWIFIKVIKGLDLKQEKFCGCLWVLFGFKGWPSENKNCWIFTGENVLWLKLLFLVNFWPTAAAKPLQSCPILCNPIDDNPPGSPIPGILQVRTLEWVAISFSNTCIWSHSVVSDS